MTMQETFDTVVNHLRQQGCKAMEGTACQYRGINNTKCAVGCLIPDHEYIADFEGWSVRYDDGLRLLMMRFGHNISLLEALQRTHDKHDVSAWEISFEEIADVYALKYKPLEAA